MPWAESSARPAESQILLARPQRSSAHALLAAGCRLPSNDCCEACRPDDAAVLGVLPIVFAALIGGTASTPALAWPQLTTELLVSLGAWIGLCAGAAAAARKRLGRSPRWRRLRAEPLAVLTCLGLHVYWCHDLGWADAVPWLPAQLLPLLVALSACWWALDVAHGAPWRSARSVSLHLRLGVLPVMVLIVAIDLFERLLPAHGINNPAVTVLVSLVIPVAALVFSPPLLTRLWRTRPLAPGPKTDAVHAAVRASGVRVARVVSWPMRGITFHNAAVIGLWGPLRYVLLSEDLLRDLDADQVKAVVGHELGHARHGHLPLYLAFLATAITWTTILADPLLNWVVTWPGADQVSPELLLAFALSLPLLLWLRIGFGVLSRSCERQADLAGAELAESPQHMQGALAAIANRGGIERDTPNWRHGSIAQRLHFLDQVRLDPGLVAWHHRLVMKARFLVLLGLALGLLILGYSQTAVTPSFNGWLDREPALAQAVNEARAGNGTDLHRWLVSQPPPIRERYFRSLLAHVESTSASPADSIRLAYAQRALLIPATQVGMGSARFTVLATNYVVYTLVAGTTAPTDDDLAMAVDLVPRLEQAEVEGLVRAQYADTIGCVYFRLGDREKAKMRFESAIILTQEALAETSDSEMRSALNEQIDLYRRRVTASEDPEATLPLEFTPVAEASDGPTPPAPSLRDAVDPPAETASP